MNQPRNILLFLVLSFLICLVVYQFLGKRDKTDENTVDDLTVFDVKKLKPLNIEENEYTKALFNDPLNTVYKYVSLPLDTAFGSHVIPLTVGALISSGDLLEVGMGIHSTSLLHRIGTDLRRNLVSVEDEYDWLKQFLIFNQTRNHQIYHINSEALTRFGSNQRWGLIFIDHGKKRYVTAIKMSQLAQVVVLHDAEVNTEKNYHYIKYNVLSYYKYACKFSLYQNWYKLFGNHVSTLILSNYLQLDKLESLFKRIPSEFGHLACNLDM